MNDKYYGIFLRNMKQFAKKYPRNHIKIIIKSITDHENMVKT